MKNKRSDNSIRAVSLLITELMYMVTYKLWKKYRNVQEKAGELMGGRVLDLDIIREYKKGKEEGRNEGFHEGCNEGEDIRKEQAEKLKEQAEKLDKQKNIIEGLLSELEKLKAAAML